MRRDECRQDRAGEPLTLALVATVVHARRTHLDRADAGDDLPRLGVAVADDLAVTVGVGQALPIDNPLLDLNLHSLRQQLPRPGPQHVGQRITHGRFARRWKLIVSVVASVMVASSCPSRALWVHLTHPRYVAVFEVSSTGFGYTPRSVASAAPGQSSPGMPKSGRMAALGGMAGAAYPPAGMTSTRGSPSAPVDRTARNHLLLDAFAGVIHRCQQVATRQLGVCHGMGKGGAFLRGEGNAVGGEAAEGRRIHVRRADVDLRSIPQ